MVMSYVYCSSKKTKQYFLGKTNWPQTGSHGEGEHWYGYQGSRSWIWRLKIQGQYIQRWLGSGTWLIPTQLISLTLKIQNVNLCTYNQNFNSSRVDLDGTMLIRRLLDGTGIRSLLPKLNGSQVTRVLWDICASQARSLGSWFRQPSLLELEVESLSLPPLTCPIVGQLAFRLRFFSFCHMNIFSWGLAWEVVCLFKVILYLCSDIF